MTKFEDRLISDLIDEHGSALATIERPTSRRASVRPLWIVGSAVAVAGVAAISFTLVGGGSTPAYAVTQNSDGTVTLTLNELSGIDGANQRLHQLGLPVTVVPFSPGCTAPAPPRPHSPDLSPRDLPAMQQIGSNGVTFSLRNIPAGDTLMVEGGSVALTPPVRNGPAVWLEEQLIQGSAPGCARVPKIVQTPTKPPFPSGGSLPSNGGLPSNGSLPGDGSIPLAPPSHLVGPSAPAAFGGGN